MAAGDAGRAPGGAGVFRPWVLLLVVVVVGLSVVAPFVLQGPPPPPFTFREEWAPPPSLPYAQARRISVADARERFDAGAMFVDVRKAYDQIDTIAGAVSMPVDDVAARAHELDPNQEIVTFCA